MFSGVFLLVVLLHNSDADIKITGTQMVVEQVKVLKCRCDLNSGFRGRIATFHDWKQVYVDSCTGSEYVISDVNLKNAFHTVFSMELQKFDNNTDIYTSYSVYDISNGYRYVDTRVVHCAGANRKVINLVDDGYYQYLIDKTLLYDSTPVTFQCKVNDPTVLSITAALITNSGNRIFPFNKSIVSPELTVKHHRSMLCCLYYTYTVSNNRLILQRFVKNITLLVYHKEKADTGNQTCARTSPNPGYTNKTQQFSGKSYEFSQQSSNTDKTQQFSGKSYELNQQSGNTDKIVHYSGKTSESSQQSSNTDKIVHYSGITSESSQQSSNTDKIVHYSGKTSESSQQSGNTDKIVHYSGKISESSQQSSNTDIIVHYSGKTSESSQQSGNTDKIVHYSGKTSESSQQSGNTDKSQQDSGKINAMNKNTNTTDETNKKFDNEGRKEANNSIKDYLLIIIISSISSVIVVLISIFAIKTRCWKKNGQTQRPRPPIPLPPKQPAPYTPFYENVALRGDCVLQAHDEPHYEEVIYH